jgi:hypothetical protein
MLDACYSAQTGARCRTACRCDEQVDCVTIEKETRARGQAIRHTPQGCTRRGTYRRRHQRCQDGEGVLPGFDEAGHGRAGESFPLCSYSVSDTHTQPPPVLALHLNRSVHFGAYASKNTARVHFPEVLDLTPYTTSGMLSTSPSFPISSHIPPAFTITSAAASLAVPLLQDQNTPTPPTPPRVLYRLAAVVCHYGQHSFGHYVCFRRKPRGAGRVVPPRLDEGAVAGAGLAARERRRGAGGRDRDCAAGGRGRVYAVL